MDRQWQSSCTGQRHMSFCALIQVHRGEVFVWGVNQVLASARKCILEYKQEF